MAVEQFVLVKQPRRRLHVCLGHAFDRCARLEVFPNTICDAAQQTAQQILTIFEPAIEGGGIRAGGAGDRPQGERFVASAMPESVGRFEDAVFEIGVGVTGHGAGRPYYIDAVNKTAAISLGTRYSS